MTTDIFTGKICSFYKSIYPKVKGQPELAIPGTNRLLLDILTNERYTNQGLLTKLRQSGYKSDYYNENKSALSAACISSVQDNLTISRSNGNHLFHTGFIAFDIDPGLNPMLLHPGGLEQMRDYIIDNIPYVAYLGRSVSNIGYWGLFPIAYKDEHAGHFEAIRTYFLDRRIVIDPLADVSRLRFIAYDPDAHFEPNPEIFQDTAEISQQLSNSNERIRATPNHAFFIACCRWVEAKNEIEFKPGFRHNYLRRLYSTLRHAHVSREDCLNWIYKNIISADQINCNCLDEIDTTKKW